MSNYSESEGRSVRLPLKLYLVIFLDHCGFLIILFENVTCLSLGDHVNSFAFACGYATDSSREKKYVPRTLKGLCHPTRMREPMKTNLKKTAQLFQVVSEIL
ncbi:MAG: hypothetical protein MI923_06420, partial [Phycisphaerales bacterium]|nr:hypothetical protein [Phycisphaerales bacterium]